MEAIFWCVVVQQHNISFRMSSHEMTNMYVVNMCIQSTKKKETGCIVLGIKSRDVGIQKMTGKG